MKRSIFIILILAATITAGLPLYSQDLDSLLEGFEDDIEKVEDNTGSESTNSGIQKTEPDIIADFSGEHFFTYRMPVIKDYMNYSGELKRPIWNNTLGFSMEQKYISLHSNWGINVELGEDVEYDEIVKILPLENYLSLSLDFFKLSFGFQRIAWGTADGLNPTDNFNSWDYSSGTDRKALPSLAFRLNVYPSDFMSMDFAVVGYRQESIFPYDFESTLEGQLSLAFTADQISSENTPFELASAIPGARLNFYFPVLDFSLSYLYDIDPFYTPIVDMNTPDIELVHKRIHRIGFDLKGIAGPVGLWFETCLSLTEDFNMNDPAIRNPNLSWTLGGDFNFGPDDRFYMNLQYNAKYVFDYYRDFYTDYPNGLPASYDPQYLEEYYSRSLSSGLGGEREGLINNFIIKSDFNFKNNTIVLSLVNMYSLPALYDKEEAVRYGSLYLNPSLEFKFLGALKVSVGSNLFFAWRESESGGIEMDERDSIGIFHNDSNVYVSLEYVWSHRASK